MDKILYAESIDYGSEKNILVNHQKCLTERLISEGIGFVLLGKNPIEKRSIWRTFDRDIKPVIGMYPVFISHMGAEFQDQIGNLLNGYPKLNIVMITDFPELYSRKIDSRLLVCGYNSEELIPFIKRNLSK